MGVVQHGNTANRPLCEKQVQADVLRNLKHLVTQSPISMEFHWVSSHQDRNKKWHEMTSRELINVEVDKLTRLTLATGVGDEDYIINDFPFVI